MRPMHPGGNMPMGMSGPGLGPPGFGGVPFARPPGMPMGPPAGPSRPMGADLDALLSKQTVQGRARTERYYLRQALMAVRDAHLQACMVAGLLPYCHLVMRNVSLAHRSLLLPKAAAALKLQLP